MKNDFILPILALSMVCLVMAGALGIVNNLTSPIIEEGRIERADAARRDIIPGASFSQIHIEAGEIDDFPASFVSAYVAEGADGSTPGMVLTVDTRGFGGIMRVIAGINLDGVLISSAVLSHNETPGLGTGVFGILESTIESGGINAVTLHEIDSIAGSTVTMDAYRQALNDAFAAFEIIVKRGLHE